MWGIRQCEGGWEVIGLGGLRLGKVHANYETALAAIAEQLAPEQTNDGLLPETWEGDIAFSLETGDGRDFTSCSWSWRDPSVSLEPLMLQTQTDMGHFGAELAGFIETLSVQDGTTHGSGRFYDTPTGVAARDLLLGGRRFGVSVDPGQVEASWECTNEDEDGWCLEERITFLSYEIIGVTMTPFPAFAEAAIQLAEGVVAAATDFGDLPLADLKTFWDPVAAVGNVKKLYSSDGSGDEGTMDWGKYQGAFAWYDEATPDSFDSYRLPIADAVGTTLTAIPNGIFAAAAMVMDAAEDEEEEGPEETPTPAPMPVKADGGPFGPDAGPTPPAEDEPTDTENDADDIPDADMDAVKALLGKYYDKMATQFKDPTIKVPWGSDTVAAAATPFGDLPLMDRNATWDSGAADGRVRALYSSDGSGDTDKMDWGSYQKAFAWYDSANPKAFGSYKLPFADVDGTTLKAVPKGIFSAAGVVQGARGGSSIPDADLDGVKASLGRYYTKMAKQFKDDTIKAPWSASVVPAVAAAALSIPLHPPVGWLTMDEPQIGDPLLVEQIDGSWAVPPTIGDDGRVFGHIARRGAYHVGDSRTQVPKSPTNYAHFNVGVVVADDDRRISTGPLVMGCDHPGLGLDVYEARDHYAHSGMAWADVHVIEGEHGPWACGVLRPNVTEAQLRILRASAWSGDWRARSAGIWR